MKNLKEQKKRLEKVHLQLQKRYEELFEMCVKYLEEGNREMAKVYANEAAFVQKLDKKILALLSKIQ